jgi:hypothetical protein
MALGISQLLTNRINYKKFLITIIACIIMLEFLYSPEYRTFSTTPEPYQEWFINNNKYNYLLSCSVEKSRFLDRFHAQLNDKSVMLLSDLVKLWDNRIPIPDLHNSSGLKSFLNLFHSNIALIYTDMINRLDTSEFRILATFDKWTYVELIDDQAK